MHYGLFSDIHGNLEALTAVLAKLRELGAEKLICLGDLVGYGARPNDCVSLVREEADVVLAGNHDYAVARRTSIDHFNQYAREAILWTRREVTPENMDYLAKLPLTHTFGPGFLAVHAAPCSPEEWGYILDGEDAREQFPCFEDRACFVGHTHYPLIARLGEKGEVTTGFLGEAYLDVAGRFIVNIGSVGQPRDGDPRAAAVLLCSNEERGSAEVTLVREPYDITCTQRQILAAGLPPLLASRLEEGR